MAIGDPQKVINPGGHSYGGKETKVAKSRMKTEMRAQAIGKATPPARGRGGDVVLPSRSQTSPKGQPSSFTARSKGGYDPAKGSTKDKSPTDNTKKKAYKASGIKGRTRR